MAIVASSKPTSSALLVPYLYPPLLTYSTDFSSHPSPATHLTFMLKPPSRDSASTKLEPATLPVTLLSGLGRVTLLRQEMDRYCSLHREVAYTPHCGEVAMSAMCVQAPWAQKGELNTMVPFIDFSLYLRHVTMCLNEFLPPSSPISTNSWWHWS